MRYAGKNLIWWIGALGLVRAAPAWGADHGGCQSREAFVGEREKRRKGDDPRRLEKKK